MLHDKVTRRSIIKAAGLGALGLMTPASLWGGPALSNMKPSELILYVGTYTSGRSEGIYVYRMDVATGELKHIATARGVANPSFLALNPQKTHLFAVNELLEYEGQPSGAVSSFAIEPGTYALRPVNQQPSKGGAPCYLTVDQTGRYVLVANYMGGNIAVLPISAEGKLAPVTSLSQHQGSSVNTERQEGPHAHSVILDRSNQFAFAADLGLDKVLVYRFDPTTGQLKPNSFPEVRLKPGAGPRHFVIHQNGRFAYVINELDSTLTAFSYDPKTAAMQQLQTLPTLPANFTAWNSCADLHLAPSGKFLYGSNRGHNSIVVYAIDEKTGKLTHLQHESTQGKTPRNFVIDPTGNFLLAANQDSDSIVTFRIDPIKGVLRPTGQVTEMPMPVCLKFHA